MKKGNEEELNELANQIEAAAHVLQTEGFSRWSDELLTDAEILRQGNRSGCARFLSHFGGMGSLNDIQVGTANTNAHFEALCSSAQRAARLNYPSFMEQLVPSSYWLTISLAVCVLSMLLKLAFA